MKIAVFGNKSSTANLLKYLLLNEVNISTLITFKANSLEASSISGYSSGLKTVAIENGINLIEVNDYSMRSNEIQKEILDQHFDLGIVTGWQRLIPPRILRSFSLGVFGWHGSFMRFPNGRGRSPLNWSIRLGADRIYHNFFKYDEGADTGGIYDIGEFAIEPSDYIADLQLKALDHMKTSSLRLVKDYLEDKSVTLLKQPDGVGVEFPKLTPSDSRLQPEAQTSLQAMDIIRASSHPFPGAFLEEKGKKIIIWRASLRENLGERLEQVNFIDGPIFLQEYETG